MYDLDTCQAITIENDHGGETHEYYYSLKKRQEYPKIKVLLCTDHLDDYKFVGFEFDLTENN